MRINDGVLFGFLLFCLVALIWTARRGNKKSNIPDGNHPNRRAVPLTGRQAPRKTKSHDVPTKLEISLSSFDLDRVHAIYKSSVELDRLEAKANLKSEDIAVASALSGWAMCLVYRFASGLRGMQQDVEKACDIQSLFSFDIVAFEAAAFIYDSVIREYSDEEGSLDELSMGYFECLKKSLHISARSMTHNSGFDLNEEFLINRLTTYSHAEKFKSLSRDENFLALLISSVKKGEVGEARVHEGISPGLVFQVAAATYIPIFKSSLLDNFKRGAILMYIAH